MFHSFFRQRLAFVTSCTLLMLMFLSLIMFPSTAFAKIKSTSQSQVTLTSFTVASPIVYAPTTGAITVQRVWTRDGNGNDTASFAPGAAIQYAVIVNNSSGNPLTVTFNFNDFWGTINDGVIQILDQAFSNETLPVGQSGWYVSGATVPKNALPGSYTDRVGVWDQNNYQNQDIGFGSFAVTGSKSLSVHFYSQYKAPANEQNEDCGPTSVAMVLSYYSKGPSGTPGQQIAAVRKVIGDHDGNYTGSTIGRELEYAIGHYGASYSEISQYITGLQNPDAQLVDMAAAIEQGQPTIALINGADFGRGSNYGGHWLVVIGFSNDGTNTYVILNDPDDQAKKNSNWIKGGPHISVLLSTFGNAIQDGRGLEPNNIAGITVTG